MAATSGARQNHGRGMGPLYYVVYWGYVGMMENWKLLYRGHIGVVEG